MGDLTPGDVHVPAAGRKKTMAEITTKKRNALPKDKFADQAERKYPVDTKARADNAAARLEQQKGSMSPSKYKAIKARIVAAQKRFGEKPQGKKPMRTLRVRAELAEGGSLHVRHMSDGSSMVHAPGLVAMTDDAGAKWVQIGKPGTFRGHSAGSFTLSSDVFRNIVRNFKEVDNGQVPVDFEHASEQPATEGTIPTEGAPAQGWIRDLKVEPDGTLWALVDWGDKARQYIKSGQYKFCSPAIRFGAKHPVTGADIGERLTSLALTNQPFLRDMQPLAAKDSLAHAPHEYMGKLKACLGMNELCSAHECKEQLGRLRDHYAECGDVATTREGVNLAGYMHPLRDLVGAAPGTTWEEVFDIVEDLIEAAIDRHVLEEHGGGESEETMTYADDEDDGGDEEEMTMADKELATLLSETQTENAKLSLQLKDVQAAKTAADTLVAERDTQIKTLRDELATRDERDIKARVDEAFDTYKDKMSLTDAHKPMMTMFLKSDRAGFDKLYPSMRPGERALLRNLTDHPTPGNAPFVASDNPLLTLDAKALTNHLMASERLSFADAQNKAAQIIRCRAA